jgi:hypothetical protein
VTLVGRYLRSVGTGMGGLLYVVLGLFGAFMPPKEAIPRERVRTLPRCPVCNALAGDPCREVSQPNAVHAERLRRRRIPAAGRV